jgi:GT2 family glycosyltransferase
MPDARAATAMTNGQLPMGAFAHQEATSIGVVDLARPAVVVPPPTLAALAPARDALVLVRLHGHSLALVYLDRPAEELDSGELAARVWAAAAERITDHARRHGCCATPLGADALMAGLGTDERCPPRGPDSLAVSVIIPTNGRPDRLRRCLESLRSALRDDSEVIVVDNEQHPGETERVVEEFAAGDDRFRYLHEPRAGSPVARNRGVWAARGDLVAFTDDDVVVDERWLDSLAAPFAYPQVGVVTGPVLPLVLETAAQKRFERYAGFSKGLEPRLYDLGEYRADDRFMYPFWGGLFGSGNNMAFRRSVLIGAGGFDAALNYGSDTEALSTAVRRGARLAYQPHAITWHEHRRDEDGLQRQVFNYGAGMTMGLIKALLSDRRCVPAIARSVPIAVSHRRRHAAADDAAWTAPRDLLRAQRRGMLRGPWRYFEGRRRVRRLALDRVIDGQ